MDENLKNLISRRIKRSLSEAKISQTQLSTMIKKSRAYVSNITKGRYMPKINELQQIAIHVNKPLGYFFGEDTAGLMHFVEKANKWDKVAQMVGSGLSNEINEDIVYTPLVSVANIKEINRQALLKLLKEAKTFIPLSKIFLRDTLKYFKPPDKLFTLSIFVRDYPTFGIKIGDLAIIEPVDNNNIDDGSGKLFAFIYKNISTLKRIYKEGNEYYFEPINTEPEINRVNIKDPNLIIVGRVLFRFNIKSF